MSGDTSARPGELDSVKPAKASFPGKRCFVIMPYGKRNAVRDDPATEIDFDAIYKDIIEPAVKSLELKCIRSDKVSRSGRLCSTFKLRPETRLA